MRDDLWRSVSCPCRLHDPITAWRQSVKISQPVTAGRSPCEVDVCLSSSKSCLRLIAITGVAQHRCLSNSDVEWAVILPALIHHRDVQRVVTAGHWIAPGGGYPVGPAGAGHDGYEKRLAAALTQPTAAIAPVAKPNPAQADRKANFSGNTVTPCRSKPARPIRP